MENTNRLERKAVTNLPHIVTNKLEDVLLLSFQNRSCQDPIATLHRVASLHQFLDKNQSANISQNSYHTFMIYKVILHLLNTRIRKSLNRYNWPMGTEESYHQSEAH